MKEAMKPNIGNIRHMSDAADQDAALGERGPTATGLTAQATSLFQAAFFFSACV